jgi:hypothetical protein
LCEKGEGTATSKKNGMNTLTINKSSCATKVWFRNDKLYGMLEDGRELAVPVDWFPKL